MRQVVRFVHAADLHLDAPFKGIDASDPRVRDALLSSTYEALDRVVAICIERNVDFLVLAGDIYNQAEKQLRAEFAFRDACERLAEAGIEVYVARGNHDPSSGFSAGLTMPETVHFFSDREIERLAFVRDGEEVCALYGRSFRTTAETENLAKGFKRAKRDRLAIGVLHTNVGGRTDYEPYAPCTIEDLRAAKMDYWALGHIHKPEVLSESPHIAYAGCTQGLDPSESGVRGCSVVTLADGGATVEFVPTASILWDRASVPCDSAEDVDDVRALVLDAVASSRRDSDSRPVVLRVEIGGRSVAHAMLARSGALRDLLADVRAEALERDPWVWIDRIADRTRPAIDLEAVREGHDFAGDLVRRADAVLAEDRETLAYIQSIGRVAFDALDARDVPDIDAASIVERARDLALDHLLAEEER